MFAAHTPKIPSLFDLHLRPSHAKIMSLHNYRGGRKAGKIHSHGWLIKYQDGSNAHSTTAQNSVDQSQDKKGIRRRECMMIGSSNFIGNSQQASKLDNFYKGVTKCGV